LFSDDLLNGEEGGELDDDGWDFYAIG